METRCCSSGTLCRKARACAMDSTGRLPKRQRLRVSLRQGTAGATADGIQARDGNSSAVVPALCAGSQKHPQWISRDVCRVAGGCAFLSGRGLPELQRTAFRRGMGTRRCSSGTLCRKDRACAMDFARRWPKRWRLRVSLRQGTAGATANGIQVQDGDPSAVVPALCAGRLWHAQWISPDVCRSPPARSDGPPAARTALTSERRVLMGER